MSRSKALMVLAGVCAAVGGVLAMIAESTRQAGNWYLKGSVEAAEKAAQTPMTAAWLFFAAALACVILAAAVRRTS